MDDLCPYKGVCIKQDCICYGDYQNCEVYLILREMGIEPKRLEDLERIVDTSSLKPAHKLEQ